MGKLVHILLVCALWMFSVITATAQDEDKGFLTRTIQDALSGAGRSVSIDGFAGALSSAASFDRMTISDADGIWLTLLDVKLDWNRSALLRGRLEVESLTAMRLEIPRLPIAEEDALPEAEAGPFRLPDLPVSIQITEFAVDQIALGAPLLGEAAELSIQASALYTDDEGDVDIQARRIDGKQGDFAIRANFERSDAILDLLVNLTEGPEGIAARLLNIPDQPSVDLSIAGSGPLDDFTSDVKVSTDGEERLAGQVTLGVQSPRRASGTPDRRIQADIGGDITAILAPRYREFFGTDVRLKLDALREGNGAIEVSAFSLNAQAAELEGQVTLNQDNWPTFVAVRGTIANPDGTNVLLPVSGGGTTVEQVGLRIDYDANAGDAFDAAFDISALNMPGVAIDQTKLAMTGTLQGRVGSVGEFAGDVTFGASGLQLTNAATSEALGDSISGKATITYVEGQPIRIDDLDLSGADYGLMGMAEIAGIDTGLLTQLDIALSAQDISRFSALAGRELDGATELALTGEVGLLSSQFDLQAKGSATDILTGIAQADALLAGVTEVSMTATRNEDGTFLRDLLLKNAALDLQGAAELRTDDSQVEATFRLDDIARVVPQYSGPIDVTATARQDAIGWRVDADTRGPYDVALSVDGLATGPNAVLNFAADVPDLAPFAEGVDGPLKAKGTLRQTPDGWQIDTDASGPYAAQAAINGLVSPQLDVAFDMSLPNVQPLVPQMNGPLNATGRLRQTDAGFVIDTDANGPYASRASVSGLATGPDMALTFDLEMPNVAPLAPGINGPLSANGQVRQTEAGIALNANAAGPYSAQARVDGVVTGAQAAVEFSLSMPNIGALVDKINGPLDLRGTARKQGDAWRLDTSADGPAGTSATVAGLVNADGTLNLDLAGTAPLGLSRPFLAPRDLQGLARFDLTINGPPALSSLSGTVQTSDATFTAPNLRVALRDIAADVRLGNNRAQIDMNAAAVNGGRLSVGGSVTLTGSFPAELQIALQDLVMQDPNLYRTTLNGGVRVAGPLTGGAQISGQIDVGETNVSVPSTGLTSIGDIPPITHVGAKPQVIATRRKAGLTGADAGADPAEGSSGPGYGLNLRINAPGRIFVRGRGIDAELGGALTLTGNTNRVISAGQFELLRGRLSILGKRFELVEGKIEFQGGLVPYIRFVTETETSTGEVRVIVQGPADEPEVSFESTPDAPQDEVLAQLLFGRNISDISAFQALQLANAVATLAGRGGTGLIANLREGFGLDDLDVITSDSGATAVRAGKYLSENIYSDVTAASDGTGEVSLNIDITPNLTGKATLESDGNTGIGIFFEKDY